MGITDHSQQTPLTALKRFMSVVYVRFNFRSKLNDLNGGVLRTNGFNMIHINT